MTWRDPGFRACQTWSSTIHNIIIIIIIIILLSLSHIVCETRGDQQLVWFLNDRTFQRETELVITVDTAQLSGDIVEVGGESLLQCSIFEKTARQYSASNIRFIRTFNMGR